MRLLTDGMGVHPSGVGRSQSPRFGTAVTQGLLSVLGVEGLQVRAVRLECPV